jgi:hypothetical protein
VSESRSSGHSDIYHRGVDHYEALGVRVDAEAAEVRQAYLRAARAHHPDFHLDADEGTRARSARKMQELNDAWAVLGDPAARRRYDLSLDRPDGPPTERIRPNRDPQPPPGTGWTPRRGDDRWQSDFRGWADERDELDDDGPPGPRGALAVLPVALFAAAILCGLLGVVLSARALLAAAFGLVVVSAALFAVLPILTMARGRDRD